MHIIIFSLYKWIWPNGVIQSEIKVSSSPQIKFKDRLINLVNLGIGIPTLQELL